VDPYAMSTLPGKLYVPQNLYGGSTFAVMHDDPFRPSWALRATLGLMWVLVMLY